MQDFYYPEIFQFSLNMKATFYGFTLVPKKYHLKMFLKVSDVIKESQFSAKIKYFLCIHFHAKLLFGLQQSHLDQKKSHNIVQLNPDEDKHDLLTPYPNNRTNNRTAPYHKFSISQQSSISNKPISWILSPLKFPYSQSP